MKPGSANIYYILLEGIILIVVEAHKLHPRNRIAVSAVTRTKTTIVVYYRVVGEMRVKNSDTGLLFTQPMKEIEHIDTRILEVQ